MNIFVHFCQDQVDTLTFQNQSLRDKAKRFEEALKRSTDEQIVVSLTTKSELYINNIFNNMYQFTMEGESDLFKCHYHPSPSLISSNRRLWLRTSTLRKI